MGSPPTVVRQPLGGCARRGTDGGRSGLDPHLAWGLCSYQLHRLLRKKNETNMPAGQGARAHLEQVGLVLAWPWPEKHG